MPNPEPSNYGNSSDTITRSLKHLEQLHAELVCAGHLDHFPHLTQPLPQAMLLEWLCTSPVPSARQQRVATGLAWRDPGTATPAVLAQAGAAPLARVTGFHFPNPQTLTIDLESCTPGNLRQALVSGLHMAWIGDPLWLAFRSLLRFHLVSVQTEGSCPGFDLSTGTLTATPLATRALPSTLPPSLQAIGSGHAPLLGLHRLPVLWTGFELRFAAISAARPSVPSPSEPNPSAANPSAAHASPPCRLTLRLAFDREVQASAELGRRLRLAQLGPVGLIGVEGSGRPLCVHGTGDRHEVGFPGQYELAPTNVPSGWQASALTAISLHQRPGSDNETAPVRRGQALWERPFASGGFAFSNGPRRPAAPDRDSPWTVRIDPTALPSDAQLPAVLASTFFLVPNVAVTPGPAQSGAPLSQHPISQLQIAQVGAAPVAPCDAWACAALLVRHGHSPRCAEEVNDFVSLLSGAMGKQGQAAATTWRCSHFEQGFYLDRNTNVSDVSPTDHQRSQSSRLDPLCWRQTLHLRSDEAHETDVSWALCYGEALLALCRDVRSHALSCRLELQLFRAGSEPRVWIWEEQTEAPL